MRKKTQINNPYLQNSAYQLRPEWVVPLAVLANSMCPDVIQPPWTCHHVHNLFLSLNLSYHPRGISITKKKPIKQKLQTCTRPRTKGQKKNSDLSSTSKPERMHQKKEKEKENGKPDERNVSNKGEKKVKSRVEWTWSLDARRPPRVSWCLIYPNIPMPSVYKTTNEETVLPRGNTLHVVKC
jgi:hypothetical protein